MPELNIRSIQPQTFSQIVQTFGHGHSGDHHVRMEGERLYTSSRFSLTALKEKFSDKAVTARDTNRKAGLETLKNAIDLQYGKGSADRALVNLGLRDASGIKGSQLVGLQTELNRLQATSTQLVGNMSSADADPLDVLVGLSELSAAGNFMDASGLKETHGVDLTIMAVPARTRKALEGLVGGLSDQALKTMVTNLNNPHIIRIQHGQAYSMLGVQLTQYFEDMRDAGLCASPWDIPYTDRLENGEYPAQLAAVGMMGQMSEMLRTLDSLVTETLQARNLPDRTLFFQLSSNGHQYDALSEQLNDAHKGSSTDRAIFRGIVMGGDFKQAVDDVRMGREQLREHNGQIYDVALYEIAKNAKMDCDPVLFGIVRNSAGVTY